MSKIKTKLLEDSEKATIRSLVKKDADQIATEVELLVAVVKTLNEGLVDKRLDTKKGLMEVLDEYRAYARYTGQHFIMYVNGEEDRKGEMLTWFEV